MKISGAQAICKVISEFEVKYVFGYPGGANLPLYDAMRDADFTHILTVHEQCAAHAADGFARASGKVGVCIATSGPGATNLVTGLATAYLDSSPIVAITGQVAKAMVGTDAFQEVDTTGITMPVTKHNFLVTDAQKLIKTLRRAFEIATSGRPGPVLVDVPRDIQMTKVEYFPPIQKNDELKTKTYKQKKASASIDMITQAANQILCAQRPVIIVGGGVVGAAAGKFIDELMDLLCIPVVHTLMGKGAISSKRWQNLGLTGMHGKKKANKTVYNADLVLAIGCRFNDRVTSNREKYAQGKTFIHVDIDPAEIDKNINSIGLNGDVNATLSELLLQITKHVTKGEKHTVENCMDDCWRLEEWWAIIKNEYQDNQPEQTSIVPAIMSEINSLHNDECVFVTDVGQHQIWAAQYLHVYENRGWITSGGLGTMGFGIPAAMGGQMAIPNKRFCVIVGDGGFKMTGAELYTIAALNLPIIVIVIENGWLGMVKQLQQAFFKGEYFGTQLTPNMDFTLWAAAFGIKAETVASVMEFSAVFNRVLATDGPRVIVVQDDKGGWIRPMLEAGGSLDDYIDI